MSGLLHVLVSVHAGKGSWLRTRLSELYSWCETVGEEQSVYSCRDLWRKSLRTNTFRA